MPKYVIPVIWEVFGVVTVEAEDLQGAMKIAQEAPLPDGDYIDESFRIDHEGIPVHNDDDDIRQEYKHLFDDDFRDI